MKKWLVRISLSIVALAMILAASERMGGIRTASRARPAYIKEVVAYKEGDDGFVVYFTLADANGAPVRCDGRVSLWVEDPPLSGADGSRSQPRVLYLRPDDVKASDFVLTSAGLGTFKHDVLAYSFGRVELSHFTLAPAGRDIVVRVEFTTAEGLKLEGHDDVFF